MILYQIFIKNIFSDLPSNLERIRNSDIIDENNKPQMNADERRYIHVTGFIGFPICRHFPVTDSGRTTHRKGPKERKAAQQESLCSLCSPWLNVFSARRMRARPCSLPLICGQAARGLVWRGRRDEGE